ncbi:D-alanyl-D-alanine carboxypeptidase / D-alanyl-D-alanine-endopeptidase (penicillin-binding protein 4) [Thermomonospora echinospora]|uniref:D-alanyl-D-alanine carboxypeptidase / D-alanyl-D-alanine-endopeptidase (Penicillin-binding protein 4) n=1 Tax=Thermomonospora echinospora TaxID=1992 RepID=A0A1H5YTZ7_9ACTN|nr:D-alanyl-D-alanine carboxypeptidase/D-alanyl-D-alanine-endopeptidase [Thermomonospora echinospora]SEG27683.1 D-alanyl-D-alanine carboxypeptidase / D-alanyl-D-alanine-endopeptidase (penicillin-binding protein 4) [Thermomonospora echinospora]
MPRRERIVAVITLCLLQVCTAGAGVAVIDLTPRHRVAPRPPAVAARTPVQVTAPMPGTDPDAPVPSAAVLTERLAALADGPGPKIGAVVIDAETGRTLFDRDARRPATPASTTKLVTSVAALSALGPDHRITTRVVRGGTEEAVVLVGGGDPTLTARTPAYGAYPQYASLDDLARQTADALKKAGVARIRVDYDTSLYEGGSTAEGWKPNYLPDGEVAPMSALTVDEGRTRLGEQTRVSDPAASAARTFARMLDRHGVPAKAGRRTVAERAAPTLGAVQSPPVSALVEHLMTVSDNDVAEALLRQVAVKRNRPASFEGGSQAVMAELARLGVAEGVRVNDGSGLSTRNRITPLALARIASLAASGAHPELRAAITGMPVAGFTGTLSAPRYTGPGTAAGAGVVRAKTGTLSGVSTLAGLVQDADGRLLAFAFMLGDGEGPVDRGRLDLLAAAVAACGCRTGP